MTPQLLHDLEFPDQVLLLSIGGALLDGFHRHQSSGALMTGQIVGFGFPHLESVQSVSARSFPRENNNGTSAARSLPVFLFLPFINGGKESGATDYTFPEFSPQSTSRNQFDYTNITLTAHYHLMNTVKIVHVESGHYKQTRTDRARVSESEQNRFSRFADGSRKDFIARIGFPRESRARVS